jgi:uncharacterized protein YbcI
MVGASARDEGRTARHSLNYRIANAVVRLFAHHVGRGPTKARAFHRGDMLVVILEDVLTKGEHKLVGAGMQGDVEVLRRHFHEMMEDDLTTVVAELTGRTVTACMSGSNAEANMVLEVFILDRPLPEADDGALPPAPADGGGPV